MKKLEELITRLGELAYVSHHYCEEDSWYSCPKAPDGCSNDAVGTECKCGADSHNAEVDEDLNRALIVNKWSAVLENPSTNMKAMLIESQERGVKT